MDAGAYLLQLGAQLIVVIGTIVLGAWLLKRFSARPGGAQESIRISAVRNLGGKERLVIVEVEGRSLLVGLSPGGMSKLYEFDHVPSESDMQTLAESSA